MQIDPQAAQIYAKAVFNLGLEQKKLDALAEDVRSIEDILATEQGTRLRQFLESPMPLIEDQLRSIDTVFGSRVAPVLVNVMKMMMRKQRIMVLGEMLELLRVLIDRHHGREPGVVFTAVELSEDEKNRLRDRLQEVTGRTYSMEYRVQPSLLGGVVFKAGDMLIDWSVKHRLSELRDRLMHVKLPAAG